MTRHCSVRPIAAFCFGVLALAAVPSLNAQEPTDEWMIAAAVLAAPPQFRAAAEVRKWDHGSLVTIREGSGVICIADTPGDDAFRGACYHESLEPFMARGRELKAEGLSGMKYQEARWADADAGRLKLPEHMAMVFNLSFACEDFDPATADPTTGGRLHAAYAPYLTPEMSGLPLAPQTQEPWLMWPGKAGAHVMVAIPAVDGDPVCGGDLNGGS
jgi:hypothetical protein